MDTFSHINQKKQPSMVDVGEKKVTYRTAIAQSIIAMPANVIEELQKNDFESKKGAVFQTAIIAGIMAAKKTGELIPLCHPLGMHHCNIDIALNKNNDIIIQSTAKIKAKTGVEMEALTGASIAALTIYDMCKALSHDIIIKETKLIEKKGGKNDFKRQ